MAGSKLQLSYIFTPTPYPIRASGKGVGAKANKVNLDVIISNPSRFDAVTMKEIEIAFPVGDDIAADLAVSPVLDLTYDTSGPWVIKPGVGSNGQADGSVTVTPAPGTTGDITVEAIEFTAFDIVVNEQPGTARFTITEVPAAGHNVTDGSTYLLRKLDADFPVVSFSADPTVIYDLDQHVSLSWTVSEEGQAYQYGVRIAGVGEPGSEKLYSWRQGQPFVQTFDKISKTTRFELDVVAPPSSGKQFAPLQTTVTALFPGIADLSRFVASPSNRLISMHWKAVNASGCTVKLDNVTIDNDAPIDTYDLGYVVNLTGNPGEQHQIELTALAKSGSATKSITSPLYTIGTPTPIQAGPGPLAIAFTPDSKYALVGNQANLTVLDMSGPTALRTVPTATTDGSGPVAIAVSPDGRYAFTADLMNSATAIDIGAGWTPTVIKIPPPPGAMWSGPCSVAITRDSAKALVPDANGNYIIVIDIPSLEVESDRIACGPSPMGIAITPDGKAALVTNNRPSSVTCVDIEKRVVIATITGQIGTQPSAIAITPDGKTALVTNWSADGDPLADTVSFIAMDTLQVEGTAKTGTAPIAVSVTTDSSTAVVANYAESGVTFIDIARRTSTTISNGETPDSPKPVIQASQGIAIAPNGSAILASRTKDLGMF